MKLSDMIFKLQNALDQYGDLPVKIDIKGVMPLDKDGKDAEFLRPNLPQSNYINLGVNNASRISN